MYLKYSLIIPVYNRPDEILELLQSIEKQTFKGDYEIIIVEDGSQIDCKNIVKEFENKLPITYFYKENSGPGASRNYAMQRATGNYFIILDSDCLLPEHYLEAVDDYLKDNFVDCFGGSDTATEHFSDIQKAINYAMTSFFTTGGIRGSKKSLTRFEPRSFNMGISKKAFEQTQGFGKIHPGEDPDLSIRLWKMGFKTSFIETAFVYHKRRISWEKFKTQVSKFGQTRPILNFWHPEYEKIIHFLPTFFLFGLIFSIFDLFFGYKAFIWIYISYFCLIFVDSYKIYKSKTISFLSVWAVFIQFLSYGYGFLKSTIKLKISKKTPEELFPHLFFN